MSGPAAADANTSRRRDGEDRIRQEMPMREVSNVRGAMRHTEAGQFDAMRPTCDQPTTHERRKQAVFPRDSGGGN